MNPHPVKSFARVLLVLALLGGLIYGTLHLIYNWQFNALKRELHRNDYTIVGQWRHEDVSLEDFGFNVSTSGGEFGIDILDGSDVRSPGDRIEGFSINHPGEKGRADFLLTSVYWKNLRLPEINTVADALRYMPQILGALRGMPPANTNPDGGWYDTTLKKHLVLRIPKPPAKELPSR